MPVFAQIAWIRCDREAFALGPPSPWSCLLALFVETGLGGCPLAESFSVSFDFNADILTLTKQASHRRLLMAETSPIRYSWKSSSSVSQESVFRCRLSGREVSKTRQIEFAVAHRSFDHARALAVVTKYLSLLTKHFSLAKGAAVP